MYRLLPWLAFSLVLSTVACSSSKDTTAQPLLSDSTSHSTSTNLYMDTYALEIAVRKVKTGQLDAFKTARSAFITKLKTLEGVEADREFASFYALPQPDETEVFIGMTTWASPQAAQAASEVLMPSEEAGAFFSTLDFKAYVMAQLLEGKDFDLNKLAAKPGQVLELAVRSVNEGQAEAFQATRKAFVELLGTQAGVLESYEFKVISENDQRLTVGMTVYESQEAFQQVSAQIMQDSLTQAYFATFTPVAVQYALSTSNQ